MSTILFFVCGHNIYIIFTKEPFKLNRRDNNQAAAEAAEAAHLVAEAATYPIREQCPSPVFCSCNVAHLRVFFTRF